MLTMHILSLKERFLQELTPLYDQNEAQQLFLFTLDELEHKSRIDLVMDPSLQSEQPAKWLEVLDLLKQFKPIQYIFNKAYFYGLNFKVTSDTLIPRSETEELVEWILASCDHTKALKILDIGSGSGCIGITLGHHLPLAKVTLMDVSPQALGIATQNALDNKVVVNTILQDVLALDELPDSYDIIVSNPPYVRELEKVEIKENVLAYEPHLALFVQDSDPLIFYRHIAHLAQGNLGKNGMLFYEINQYLGQQTLALFQSLDFQDITLKKDLMQNDRMIRAFKK